jgi:hypothetical protein
MGKIECNILGIIVHVMFIAPLIVTMDTSSGGWFLNDLKELKFQASWRLLAPPPPGKILGSPLEKF